ncbi:MAG: hypothetical protein NNA18_07865 [Nitrospira sp.]|nr:hypothetical protein [Nitrospira sp.]
MDQAAGSFGVVPLHTIDESSKGAGMLSGVVNIGSDEDPLLDALKYFAVLQSVSV